MPYINGESFINSAHLDKTRYGGKLKIDQWNRPHEVLYSDIEPPEPPKQEFIFSVVISDPDLTGKICIPVKDHSVSPPAENRHVISNITIYNIGNDPDNPRFSEELDDNNLWKYRDQYIFDTGMLQNEIDSDYNLDKSRIIYYDRLLEHANSGDYFHLFFRTVPASNGIQSSRYFNPTSRYINQAKEDYERIIEWYEILPPGGFDEVNMVYKFGDRTNGYGSLLNLRKFQIVLQDYTKTTYDLRYSFLGSGRTALPLSKDYLGNIKGPTMMDFPYVPRGHDIIYRQDKQHDGSLKQYTIGEDLAGTATKTVMENDQVIEVPCGIPLNMSILTMPDATPDFIEPTSPPTGNIPNLSYNYHYWAFTASVHSPLLSISPHLNYAWKKTSDMMPEDLTQPALVRQPITNWSTDDNGNQEDWYIIPPPMYIKTIQYEWQEDNPWGKWNNVGLDSMYRGQNIDFETVGYNDFGQSVRYWDFSKVVGVSNSVIGDETVIMLDISETYIKYTGLVLGPLNHFLSVSGSKKGLTRFSNETLEKVISFTGGSPVNPEASFGWGAFRCSAESPENPDAGGTGIINGLRMINSGILNYDSFIIGKQNGIPEEWGAFRYETNPPSDYFTEYNYNKIPTYLPQQMFTNRWGYKSADDFISSDKMSLWIMGEQFRP